ncbi:ribonuclease H-like domain, reverse transcriptase, RNA-dependent DNA polymerase [Tanacetum coccineum]|uniref:Ribonuclease H-like domain, reverse transcriptase, RNA-dependent DNA polymerase n=1 Tax=Tanacetum coccineum TaxID=301880 RepID=A0ABQ5B8S4_9ASTR
MEVLNKSKIFCSDKSCIGFGTELSSSVDSDNSLGITKFGLIFVFNLSKAKGFQAVPHLQGNPEEDLKDYAILTCGALGRGRITGSLVSIKTSCIDFEKVSYVEEGLSSIFYLFLKSVIRSIIAPRKNDVYSLDLKNIIPSGGVTCLVAKATKDEAVLWHRRLGHVNFKNINKLVKGNLVRGLPSKTFKLDHSCLACRKGKQHRASCKKIEERTVREPLELLHMDLFGPVSVESVNRKKYCLVVTNDCKQLGKFDGKSDEVICWDTPTCSKVLESTTGSIILVEQARHDEQMSFDASRTIANVHNDAQQWYISLQFLGIFSTNSFDAEEGGVADYNNMDPTIDVPSTPTLRIHKIHPQSQIIGKSTAGVQTRRKLQDSTSNQHQALLSFIYKQNRTNHKDQQTCLFACFLSQEEPKKVSQALADESWVEAMQEELLQFKLQEVWVLCDLPEGKRVIGTKWVFRNKRDERGTIIKNKARLVAQGYRQEEGVDYDEVFAPVARIEAIRLFLAFASFMGFIVYQMDVKSAFLYGNITEEVYVKQPPGFEDPAHPNKVYRVVKALYGLHQAPRAWYERLSTFLLKHGYRRGAIDKTLFIKKDRRDIMLVQVYVDDIIFGSTKSSMVKDFEDLMQKEFKMSSMGELTFFLGLQVKQSNGGIFLSQDKYVKDILNKFDFRTIKPASTPIEAHKSLGKDEEGEDVDVHLYRSMIGCLMYLTASRPDIMFAVCLCARFQVTPKVSHLHAVKRIFRYLKHQPKLGLWYPKDSPFHLEAFSDSDYAGDNHDRRSTSGGCQYLGRRLVSWQCKKQTIVAISSTEAEYVAAASCCAQVLWMQNQLLDYGFNFMNTEIHIDNESTICIVKNPVFHSKTKHIQIRHHFIRDCYEQRLINVVKVHTDDNVADLLTKGFDLARFKFLVVTIGMMNP